MQLQYMKILSPAVSLIEVFIGMDRKIIHLNI